MSKSKARSKPSKKTTGGKHRKSTEEPTDPTRYIHAKHLGDNEWQFKHPRIGKLLSNSSSINVSSMMKMPRMVLDLRGVDFDSTATDWLPGPRRFRIVGALYDDSNPLNYFYDARLPVEYDVIVYFENTTPSVLLPFPAVMEIVPPASIPLIDTTPQGDFR